MTNKSNNKSSKLWSRPEAKWRLGIPLGALLAFGLGAAALGTTNYVLHATSTTEFCYTCHSHENFIKKPLKCSILPVHFVQSAFCCPDP